MRPVRKLTDKVQMPAWQASEAHSKLLTFVQSLSKAVQGHATTDPCHESEVLLMSPLALPYNTPMLRFPLSVDSDQTQPHEERRRAKKK